MLDTVMVVPLLPQIVRMACAGAWVSSGKEAWLSCLSCRMVSHVVAWHSTSCVSVLAPSSDALGS